MYKKANTKARVKTQAADGKDQFGSVNTATSGAVENVRFAGNEHPSNIITKYANGFETLNGYFDNLATDATNFKAVLEQVVSNNKKLTVTNEELVIVIKKLTGENKQLQK